MIFARRFAQTAMLVGAAMLALGLPINDGPRFLAFAVFVLLVVVLRRRRAWWRHGAALGVAAVAALVQSALPFPEIEEGHNVYLYDGSGGVHEEVLPPEVHARLRATFLAAHPPSAWCRAAARGCWRERGRPDRPYAFAAESFWQSTRHSRIVRSIDVDGRDSLSGGFVNDLRYAWYNNSDIRRRHMPLFVHYRLPADLEGSRLCWRGDLMWRGRDDGAWAVESSPPGSPACRDLAAADLPAGLYLAAIGRDAPFEITLHPSAGLRALEGAAWLLRLTALVAALMLCARRPSPRHPVTRGQGRALLLLALTLAYVLVYNQTREHDFAFGGLAPTPGGLDGIFYESYGHDIVAALADGDWLAAFRGGEDVFHAMPGLRYVRALEKILFGETYFLYLGVLLAAPFAVFTLARTVVGRRWARGLVLAFFLLPLMGPVGLWFYNYLIFGLEQGFAEPLAIVLIFAGATMIARRVDRPGGDLAAAAAVAWFLFAVAVMCRPNYGPTAVVAILAVSWWLTRAGRLAPAVLVPLGFLPVLAVPVHNAVFGERLALATSSATSPQTMPAPPSLYVEAAGAALAGAFESPAIAAILKQWGQWLEGGALAPLLLAFLYVLVRSRLSRAAWLVGLMALSQHAVMLFWNAKVRFGYLGWALTLLVVLHAIRSWRAARARKAVRIAGPAPAQRSRSAL